MSGLLRNIQYLIRQKVQSLNKVGLKIFKAIEATTCVSVWPHIKSLSLPEQHLVYLRINNVRQADNLGQVRHRNSRFNADKVPSQSLPISSQSRDDEL